MLLVIATGLYNGLNYFVTPADLRSSYGSTLGIKLLLIIPLLIVGTWQHMTLRPRLAARLAALRELFPSALRDRLDRAAQRISLLRLEVLLMLVIVVAVAWLSATPIPEPESLESEARTPQATHTIGDFSITSAIVPAVPVSTATIPSSVAPGKAQATCESACNSSIRDAISAARGSAPSKWKMVFTS